jgi:hypothetical protein
MIIPVQFNITTATGGAFTETEPISSRGPCLLYEVQWVDGDLADGVDAVLSVTGTPSGVDKTLLTLTNANNDAVYYPRVLESDNAGTATTGYAFQGVHGQLKLAVTDGGDAKTGKLIAYLLEV